MRIVEQKEIKQELEEIWEVIKGESTIDKAVGMYNARVMALFDRIFLEIEKRVTVRRSVKWFNSQAKQLQIKCRNYEKKWLKTKII